MAPGRGGNAKQKLAQAKLSQKKIPKKARALRFSGLLSPLTVKGLNDPQSMRKLRRLMKERTPAQARKLLIASGIYTKSGELSERYKEDA
jgi:hypothetical protein